MTTYSGKISTIVYIFKSTRDPAKIPDDGWCYELNNTIYCWNSSMLEKVEEDVKPKKLEENDNNVLKIKLKTANKIKLNFKN